MAFADVLDLTTTDGLPLCPCCSDPIVPGDPHTDCEPSTESLTGVRVTV